MHNVRDLEHSPRPDLSHASAAKSLVKRVKTVKSVGLIVLFACGVVAAEVQLLGAGVLVAVAPE